MTFIGSRTAWLSATLILISQSPCLCVCSTANTMLNISETRGSCPIGSPQESACDASICDLIDDVTRLYDVKHVILLKSRHSKSSHLETRIRVRVDPLSTHHIVEHGVKNQLIQVSTLGDETYGVTLSTPASLMLSQFVYRFVVILVRQSSSERRSFEECRCL